MSHIQSFFIRNGPYTPLLHRQCAKQNFYLSLFLISSYFLQNTGMCAHRKSFNKTGQPTLLGHFVDLSSQ